MEKVFVVARDGAPLMPTSPAKARKLIQGGKARCLALKPFTIQLRYELENMVLQPVVMGVDTGSKTVGLAAVANGSVIYRAEAELRQDIPDKMEARAALRRGRRSRLRYRPARWSNRANSKRDGRLVPTAISKLSAHERLIEKVCTFLPITELALELASFDTQKMQNPEIEGVEYQRGELVGFEVREYLLAKWDRKCAYCGKKDVPFEIEHIVPRSRGGSNRISNLAIACHSCNQKKGNKTALEFGFPDIQKKAKAPLKDAAHVGGIKWALWEWAKDNFDSVRFEYGYRTKFKRSLLKWEKAHSVDAAAIALEVGEVVRLNQYSYKVWLKNRPSRQLHDTQPYKGRNPNQERRPTDTTGGKYVDKFNRLWRKNYVINYSGKLGYITGLSSVGSFRYQFFDGTKERKTINKAGLVMRATSINHW